MLCCSVSRNKLEQCIEKQQSFAPFGVAFSPNQSYPLSKRRSDTGVWFGAQNSGWWKHKSHYLRICFMRALSKLSKTIRPCCSKHAIGSVMICEKSHVHECYHRNIDWTRSRPVPVPVCFQILNLVSWEPTPLKFMSSEPVNRL